MIKEGGEKGEVTIYEIILAENDKRLLGEENNGTEAKIRRGTNAVITGLF